MTWLFTLLAMAVIALIAGVVTGRIAGAMEPPESSLSFRGLPPDTEGPLEADAVDELRFDTAVRGYRMSQVDEVLDRLGGELRRRDDEIAALRAELAGRAAAEAHGPAVAVDAVDPTGADDQDPIQDAMHDPIHAPDPVDVRGWADQGNG